MVQNVELVREPISSTAKPTAEEAGAHILFFGVVRAVEAGKQIGGLEYEAFEAMALHQFHKIFHEMEQRWPLHSVDVIHRLGAVPVGEASLRVEVLAAHRQEAFEACQFLIDQMKKVVPIWKKPIFE